VLRTFIALFVFASRVAAQNNEQDILTAVQKANGIYRTYQEFRTNSPSLTGKFKITRKKISLLDNQSGTYESIKEPVWGACLNDTIYYFQDHHEIAQSPNFYKLKFIGRYCFYEYHSVLVKSIPGGGYVDIPRNFEFVVNVNNGKSYTLDKKMMRLILSKDTALLAEFENESSKIETFEKYIRRFNERNPQDIKPTTEIID